MLFLLGGLAQAMAQRKHQAAVLGGLAQAMAPIKQKAVANPVGQPKVCEEHVGNPSWAPDWAPDLWRRGCFQRGQATMPATKRGFVATRAGSE